MNAECVTCHFLGVCTKTDPKKVLAHYVCDLYKPVMLVGGLIDLEIVTARCEIINKFGEAGLKAITSSDTIEEA